MLALWTVAGRAEAQEVVGVSDSSGGPRPFLLSLPQPMPGKASLGWAASTRFDADRSLARRAGVRTAQRSPGPERGPARKVFGALVGAAGGFFAGGYLGALIEGDRCHCDDPGLKGALIGAPVGAAVGGVLGYHYVF
jgi:hypothetical protein